MFWASFTADHFNEQYSLNHCCRNVMPGSSSQLDNTRADKERKHELGMVSVILCSFFFRANCSWFPERQLPRTVDWSQISNITVTTTMACTQSWIDYTGQQHVRFIQGKISENWYSTIEELRAAVEVAFTPHNTSDVTWNVTKDGRCIQLCKVLRFSRRYAWRCWCSAWHRVYM